MIRGNLGNVNAERMMGRGRICGIRPLDSVSLDDRHFLFRVLETFIGGTPPANGVWETFIGGTPPAKHVDAVSLGEMT